MGTVGTAATAATAATRASSHRLGAKCNTFRARALHASPLLPRLQRSPDHHTMSSSLFRNHGGKKTMHRLPSEAEGLALGTGAAMQWARLASSDNEHFFTATSDHCKRLKCTPSDWTKAEMTYFIRRGSARACTSQSVRRPSQKMYPGARPRRCLRV